MNLAQQLISDRRDSAGFSVENTVRPHDLHATILHLLGLDREKLT